ncbi:MAG: hypothetical protein WB626_00855 [Bacteroidota bacterium]
MPVPRGLRCVIAIPLLMLVLDTGLSPAQVERYPDRAWSLVARMKRGDLTSNPLRTPVTVPLEVLPPQNAPDVRIRPTTNTVQSEMSMAVHPLNNRIILASANASDYPVSTIYGTGAYWSTDAGLSWNGFDQPPAGNSNAGDPASVIDRLGYFYVGSIADNDGQGVMRSVNGGTTWSYVQISNPNGSLLDKNHMTGDVNAASPYQGNLYAAWTDFGQPDPNPIEYRRSTDRGLTWVNEQNISGTIMTTSEFGQGVNLQTGPSGEVYAAWSINQGTSPYTEKAIGFNKSTDGGVTWGTGLRAITNILGIRTTSFGTYNIRSNSFPSMAVSQMTGAIYIVWTNKGVPGVNTGDPDVYLIKSVDGGTNWSTPVRVNQDAVGNGANQWFPWISVDPETDQINVVFMDGRANIGTNLAEVYVAHSINGGASFEDFTVSDAAFAVGPLPGYGGNYAGDYIGIASRGARAYPLWCSQNPGTNAQGWVSPMLLADPVDPNPPSGVTAYSDVSTPTSMNLSWTNPTTLVNGSPIGDFVVRIKRDGVQIAEVTPPAASYVDPGLTTYTEYTYTLAARLTLNDSLSTESQAVWTAGGSPWPAPPSNVLISITDRLSTQAQITWTNPTTQRDGTPVHDLAGTRIWRNGTLLDSVAAGVTTHIDIPPPGFVYTYTLQAFNSLTPRRYSDPSAAVGGYIGDLPDVLIWQPPDALGGSADSIGASLTRLGVSNFKVDSLFEFGNDLSPFEAVFVTAGIYTDNAIIRASDPEGPAIAAYVQNGGRFYLEGGDVFNYDPESASGYNFRPLFDLLDGNDGSSDVASVSGRTVFGGLTFTNSGGNNFMDELHPASDGAGRVLWTAPTSTPSPHDTMGVYSFYGLGRGVASVVEFEGLADAGSNLKDSVMARIIRFFRQSLSPPEIAVTPLALADTLQEGETGSLSFLITNETLPPADPLLVSLSETALWLSVSPASDTIGGGTSATITAALDATGLTPGVYTTAIGVTANDPDEPLTNVQVSLTVTGSPTIVFQPDTLTRSMPPNAVAVDTLTILNTGAGPLVWSIRDVPFAAAARPAPQPRGDELYPPRRGRDGRPIQQGKDEPDLHRGNPPAEGSGGPDSAGYRWIDSDEPGGPAFQWTDITGVGTPIPSTSWTGSDDDGRVTLPLPFPFTFYGNTYSSMKLVTNGWMSFDVASTLTSYSNGAIPSTGTSSPNNALYAWWDDLDLDPTLGGTVHHYHDAPNNRFIVQFTNVPHFGTTTPGRYTFQTILYADGRILYQYLNMQQTLNSATIGIENASGTVGLQVVYNAAYVHNNLAVLFATDVSWLALSPTSGNVPPGGSAKVAVSYNTTGLTDGIYTGRLEVQSNDFPHTPAYVPVRLSVGGIFSVNVPVIAGWNIIANPVVTARDSVQELFPGALFPYAFAYQPGLGYGQAYTIPNGIGCWEKFPAGTTIPVPGAPITRDTLAVLEQGWNLVGSFSHPVDTGAVMTVPGGLRGSPFFRYDGAYTPATVLQPGLGYWLKANGNGVLVRVPPPKEGVRSRTPRTREDGTE